MHYCPGHKSFVTKNLHQVSNQFFLDHDRSLPRKTLRKNFSFLNKNQTYKERKLNMHKKSCDCAETVHENQGKRFSHRFCIESHPVPDTS